MWSWLKHQLLHPELIAAGIRQEQKSKAKATKPLQDRLSIIEDMLKDTDRQLSMLVDLYLEQNVPKEMYLERQAHLGKRHSELNYEKADVLAR